MLRIAQQVSERKVEKMNMWKSRENAKRKNKVRKNGREIKCHDRRKKKRSLAGDGSGKTNKADQSEKKCGKKKGKGNWRD